MALGPLEHRCDGRVVKSEDPRRGVWQIDGGNARCKPTLAQATRTHLNRQIGDPNAWLPHSAWPTKHHGLLVKIHE